MKLKCHLTKTLPCVLIIKIHMVIWKETTFVTILTPCVCVAVDSRCSPSRRRHLLFPHWHCALGDPSHRPRRFASLLYSPYPAKEEMVNYKKKKKFIFAPMSLAHEASFADAGPDAWLDAGLRQRLVRSLTRYVSVTSYRKIMHIERWKYGGDLLVYGLIVFKALISRGA